MKDFMRRALALFLAVLMLMPALPMTVLAEEFLEEITETVAEETEPEETEPAKTEPEETEPEKTEPEETEPEDTKPEDTKPEDTKPEETEPEDTKPEDTKPEETEPEDTKPEDTKPEETKPEDTKPEETKPEETKPEETQPEETIPTETVEETLADELLEEDAVPPLMFSMALPRTVGRSCNVQWRDNNADGNTTTRPSVQNAFSFSYTISREVDGVKTFYKIVSDGNGGFKPEPLSEGESKYQSDENESLGINLDAVFSTSDNGSFNFDLTGLAESLTYGVDEQGNPVEYEISYFIQQTDDQLHGYYLTDESNNPLVDFPSEDTEWKAVGHHVPLSAETQLYMTRFDSFHAHIQWQDGDNEYITRPGGVELTLMRYPYGASADDATLVKEKVELPGGEDSASTFNIYNLPQYDENGTPYVYYLAMPKEDGELANLPQDPENQDKSHFSKVPSWYEPKVSNEGDYNAVEDRIYEGGTVTYTLTNKTRFQVTKFWKDEVDENAVDEEEKPLYLKQRPKPELIIYRTVVPNWNDCGDPNIFKNHSPNPGYDSTSVPQKNGAMAETGYLEKVVEGKVEKIDDLPMYSPEGLRYIYYAFETGLTGDYQTEFLFNPPEGIDADLKGQLEKLYNNAKGRGFVINGGQIKNINKSELAAAPTKTFEASSIQSMELMGNTKVTMKLQCRVKSGSEPWADYKEPVLDEKGDQKVDDKGELVWKYFSQDVTGFRPEEQTRHGDAVPVNKYNEEGKELEFRWVETGIIAIDHPDEFGGGEGFPIPDHAEDEFVWMPGLGADETDVGFRIKYARDENGNPKYDTIINNLRGVFEVKAKKHWSVCGLTYDPYTFELTVGKDKLPLKDDKGLIEANRQWAIDALKAAILASQSEDDPDKLTDEQAAAKALELYNGLVDDDPVEEVQVAVLRDGQLLYRGIKDDADVKNPHFGTYDELIELDYKPDQINQVKLHVSGNVDREKEEVPWEASTQLPRYDDQGRAYKYELKEVTESFPAEWSHDKLVEKLGTTTTDILQEGTERTIPQLVGELSNVRGIVGDGQIFRFDVEKVWLDDSDVETRYPVQFSVYHLPERDENGDLPASITKNDLTLVESLTLTEKTNWKGIIEVTVGKDEVIENYLVLEDGIIGRGDVMAPVTYDKDIAFIREHQGEITLPTFYAEEGLNFAMVDDRDKGLRSGKIEDPDNALYQQYNVYIGGKKTSASEASYTVYNQRTAVIDMKLTKRWVVGGDPTKIRDVQFKVKVTGGNFAGSKWLSPVTSPKLRFAANADFVIDKNNPAIFELTSQNIVKDDKGFYLRDGEEKAFLLESAELNNSLSNLRKYDTTGKILNYAPVESAMKMSDDTWLDLTDKTFPILVEGDYLITKMRQEVEYAEKLGYHHRTHDLYIYTASNIRSDKVPIVLRKVWQDDGTNKRPDIYFTVYRYALAPDDPTDNLEALAEAKMKEHNAGSGADGADRIEIVATLDEMSLWTTSGPSTNKWYWTCELKDQDRYDKEGRPYLYFAKENFLNDFAGDYETVYYNEAKPRNDNLYPDPTGQDTEQTFGIPHKDITETRYSIILDGRNGLDWNEDPVEGMVYYPSVTVNYLKDNQTLSGMKLWKMPKNQPNVTKPPFDVALFKLTDAQHQLIKDHLNEKLLNRDSEGKYSITLDDKVIPAVGAQTVGTSNTGDFHFPGDNGEYIFEDYEYLLVEDEQGKMTLDVLDDYGRKLHYYFGEFVLPLEGVNRDPEIEEAFTGHQKLVRWELGEHITNEFTPHAPYAKISVDKTLLSSVDGVKVSELTAPITFQLYARAQSSQEEQMVAEVTVQRKGDTFEIIPVDDNKDGDKLATVKMMPTTSNQSARFILTFHSGKFQTDSQDPDKISLLPYYGPDGYPYTYFVKEKVPNGYKGETGNSHLTRMGGKTASSFFGTAWNFFNTLTQTEDEKNGLLPSDDIHPTDPDGDNTYEGSVAYTNTYWANQKRDLTVVKAWEGDDSYKNEYRPRVITLQLWRKNGDVTEPVLTNYKGEKIGQEVNDEDKVKVTTGGSLVLPTEEKGTIRIKIAMPNAVGGTKGSWSATVSNLGKYAPDGSEYKYFVREVDADNEGVPGNDYGNYVLKGEPTGTTATNVLERVQVSASKNWMGKLPDGTSVDLEQNDFHALRILHRLGALPDSISFHVQSRPAPRRAMEDPKWEDDSHAEVHTWTLDTEDQAVKAFKEMKDQTWDNLAKYVDGSKRQREIQYRVVESITWGKGNGAVTKTYYQGHTNKWSPFYADVDTEGVTPDPIDEKDPFHCAYQQKFKFTNTILIRKLEVHKYWADGQNQDNIRPDLTITVTRDGNAEDAYTFPASVFTSPDREQEHYSDWIYVPLYKNNCTDGDDESNISLYTAEEATEGKYKQYYSSLGRYATEDEESQGKTLYKKLTESAEFDENTGVYANDHYGLTDNDKFPGGTASSMDRQTDEKDLGFPDKNNLFVFANEQTTRKRVNLKAEKLWPEDPLGVSQPKVIYLQLQYRYDDETKEEDWRAADSNCGLSGSETAVKALTSPNAVKPIKTWKTQWNGLLKNKTGGPGEHPISYRVVEVANMKGDPLKPTFPYDWTWSQFGEPVDGEDLTWERSGEGTNTLKTDEMNLIKTFSGDYVNQLLPDSITFRLWYKTGNEDNWTPCPVVKTKDGYEVSSTVINPLQRIFAEDEDVGKIILNVNGSTEISTLISKMPRYDRNNHRISYAVSEVSVRYSQYVIPAHGAFRTNEQGKQTAVWEGTVGPFEGTVTTARPSAMSTTWIATAGNAVKSAEKSLTVTKTWVDEHDRDGLRKDGITLVLFRDGEKFVEVTVKPGADNKLLVNDVVVDPNPDASGKKPNVTAEKTENEDVWKITFNNLPLYQNGAEAHTEDWLSKYTVLETRPVGPTPPKYSNSSDLTLDKDRTAGITNTHKVESFNLSAVKQWSDHDNEYGLRPNEITLKLQYWNIKDQKWDDVPGEQTLPYPTATGVYTTSLCEQSITPDKDGNWTNQALWENLRKYVKTENGRVEVQYRVVEMLSSYEGEGRYGTPEPVIVRTPREGNTNRITVTNVLKGVKTLHVTKDWVDQDNAFNTRPDSIQVNLQYLIAGDGTEEDDWMNVPEGYEVNLTEENNWQHTFIDLRNDLTYRVVEVSMTYMREDGEKVIIFLDQGKVGAYENEVHTIMLLEDDLEPSSILNTILTNTLQLTKFTAEKKWSETDGAYKAFRPDSITVKLQSRIKPGQNTGLEKVRDLFTGGRWTDVQKVVNGTLETVYGSLEAQDWKTTFEDLPKYDRFGNELEYRAIETAMILNQDADAQVYPIIYKDDTRDTLVVSDSTELPYHVRYQDGKIINILKTVSLHVTKDWEDYSNRYNTRPDKIGLVITETNTGMTYTVEWVCSKSQEKLDHWSVEYTGLPAYVRPQGSRTYVKAEYKITELTVDGYKADLTQAVGTDETHYRAKITNTMIPDVGDVILTKYGKKENGPKLAGAAYRLARLDEDKSRWPLVDPKPGADSPIEYYAGQDQDGSYIWSRDPKKAKELVTDKNGTLSLDDLPYGRYRFEEIRAPKGYKLSSKPVEFTIDADCRSNRLSVFQVDKKLDDPFLPRTGDQIFLPLITMAASAASLTVLLALRRRRRR